MITPEQVKPGLRVRVLQNPEHGWRQERPTGETHLLAPGDIISLAGDAGQHSTMFNGVAWVAWYKDYVDVLNYILLDHIELAGEPAAATHAVCTCVITVNQGCTCGVFAAEMAAKGKGQC